MNLAAANPEVGASLWEALNQTTLTTRDCLGWSYKGRPHGGIPARCVHGDGAHSLLGPNLQVQQLTQTYTTTDCLTAV
jgi:hypothetical protein